MNSNDAKRNARSLATLLGLGLSITPAFGQTPELFFIKFDGRQMNPELASLVARNSGLEPVSTQLPENGGIWQDARGNVRQILQDGKLMLLPDLEAAEGTAPNYLDVNRAINNYLIQNKLLPVDGMKLMAGEYTLWGKSSGNQKDPDTKPVDVLRSFRIYRSLDGIKIIGPRSVVGGICDAKLNVVGLNFTLEKLRKTEIKPVLKTNAMIDGEIAMRARMHHLRGSFKIVKKSLIYFEQGSGWVQPAYQADVLFTDKEGLRQATSIVVAAAVNGPEPIRQDDSVGEKPIIADPGFRPTAMAEPPALSAGDLFASLNPAPQAAPVIFGQYIVREDHYGWLDDAQAFWSTVNAGRNLSSLVYSRPSLTRRDYWWNRAFCFVPFAPYADSSPNYVNQDHIVQLEGHGAPWVITTYKDYGEIIHFNTSNGYGGNRLNGKTSHLIIQSCDVVPAPGDPFGWDYTSGSAFGVWWQNFKGMRAIYGYRTTMRICNGVGGAFGFAAGFGQSMPAAWLSATDHNIFGHSNGWDYGNTVYVTGQGNATMYNNSPVPNPSSLTMWWIHA